MNRHQALYETLVKDRGSHCTKLLRQRLNDALRIRREQFIDRVRSVQSDGTYSTNSATETEELRLFHEHRNLMRGLFDEAQAENIELEVLLRLQDEVLDEFKEDIDLYLRQQDPSFVQREVICPQCSREKLVLHGTVLSCPCGLNIDTQTDSISLKSVGQSLEKLRNLHLLSGCQQPLRCLVLRQDSGTFEQVSAISDVVLLCLECNACSFLEIVV
ncbi:RPA-interacting protein [Paragonimus heterotremus]|uniref:RPA-interacting protein n=1 Tax=Paragonimus heterotremus TaxID=100268 RepID=A0A8J4WIV1_9TREM|nr:RPA-interacting protein [Paragonimus heterotremus]